MRINRNAKAMTGASGASDQPVLIQLDYGVQVYDITPAIAVIWLETNTHNIPINDGLVAAYARDMRDGRWLYNASPIHFSNKGKLLNGQHRLWACVEAGVPFRTLVIFGLEPSAQDTLDIGQKRSAGKVGALAGVPNYNVAASVAAMILMHRRGSVSQLRDYRMRPTHSEIVAAMTMPGIQDSIAKAAGQKICSQSALAFCHFVFSEQDTERAESFVNDLKLGINLTDSNPARVLRDRLLGVKKSVRLKSDHLMALIFKSWIKYRDNLPLSPSSLRWLPDEGFPDIKNWSKVGAAAK